MSETETYQGKPCRAGHAGMRYSANRACVECAKAARKARYDRAGEAAYKRAYRAARASVGNAAALGADILDSI